MMTLKIDGRTLIPASVMAMMNGENLLLEPVEFNRLVLS